MPDTIDERMFKRLDCYKRSPKAPATSIANQFTKFIVAARKKNVLWRDIAKIISEEAGVEIHQTTLRVWWNRRKAEMEKLMNAM
tara:strand:+ start:34 stop:285 length:252 start_codon:yes stop_codon:yes gene_type:complete